MSASGSRAVIHGGALIAAIAILGAEACGPARTLDPDETRPVRVGLIVPLMGELGSDGPGWRDAVVLAVHEVNAAGGVLPGRRVALAIEDSETTDAGGLRAYRSLMDQGVSAIVGDAASGSTIGIYNTMLTEDRQVPLISGLSTSIDLTTINEMLAQDEQWFFRTVPPDNFQSPALARAMYTEYSCRRIAVLFANNAYGIPFRDGVRAELTALAPATDPIVVVQPYTEALATYATEVMAVAAAMPDCVALIGYPQSAGVIINEWNLLPSPPAVRWFGTEGVRQTGFVSEVGNPALIDGFLGTSPLTDAAGPAYNRFESRYLTAFGNAEPPTAFTSNLYDATALILLAIARAGTDEPDAIRENLYLLNDPAGVTVQAGELAEGLRLLRMDPPTPINYQGASGAVDFDADGNVIAAYELWRYDAAMDRFVRDRLL